MKIKSIILMLIWTGILISITTAQKSETKLAQTPPMGWNSWNLFQCDINENLIKEIADAIVETGMKESLIKEYWPKQ